MSRLFLFIALAMNPVVHAPFAVAEEKLPALSLQGPATEATLTKLFDITEANKMMLSAAESIASVDTRISSQLPGGPGDKRKQEFLAELKPLREEFQGKALNFAEIKPAMVKLYQESWTEEEVQQLMKFYESPVGKKAIREMPEMMGKMAKLGQSQVQKYAPEFNGKVQVLLKKYYPELEKKK